MMDKKRKCLFIHIEQNNSTFHGNYRKTLAQYTALKSLFSVESSFRGLKSGNKLLRALNGNLIVPFLIAKRLLFNRRCIIYYRYYPQYIILNLILFLLRNDNYIFVEINTKNKDEFKIINKLLYFLNQLSEKMVYKSACTVLPVTPELGDYVHSIEPKCHIKVLGNGYDAPIAELDNINFKLESDLTELIKKETGKRKFIFVYSEGHVWQGLDKVIEVINHLEDSCLFIVGKNDRLDNMGISPELINSDNIHFLGTRDLTELRFLYDHCDFAFGTFALERKNMKEAVPLKVREYLYFGIPVIIGYHDFQVEGLDFVHRYHDLDSLRDFVSRPFDRQCIKDYAREKLSWRTIFKDIFLSELGLKN
jgi:hypothetical protein